MIDRKNFEEKYYELYQLLGAYFGCAADFDNFDIDITLEYYLYGFEMLEEAIKALKQMESILKLEPFPEKFIADLTCTTSTLESRREWLQKVAIKLREKIEKVNAIQ